MKSSSNEFTYGLTTVEEIVEEMCKTIKNRPTNDAIEDMITMKAFTLNNIKTTNPRGIHVITYLYRSPRENIHS